MVGLGLILGTLGVRQEYTLDGMKGHHSNMFLILLLTPLNYAQWFPFEFLMNKLLLQKREIVEKPCVLDYS